MFHDPQAPFGCIIEVRTISGDQQSKLDLFESKTELERCLNSRQNENLGGKTAIPKSFQVAL